MKEDLSIFQEIDESLRVENFEKLLKRYGKLIVATCVGIVVLTAASVFWKSHQRESNIHYTDLIIQAQALADSGKYDEAAKKFEEVESGSRGISTIAKLRHAEMLVKAGKADKAYELYNQVASGKNSDEALREFATLNNTIIAGNNRLPMTGQNSGYNSNRPFSALTGELAALRLLNEGKNKEARELLTDVAGSPRLSMSERSRIMELLSAAGEKQ